jgi:hypothetical protein
MHASAYVRVARKQQTSSRTEPSQAQLARQIALSRQKRLFIVKA